jgi:NAD(P)-dependent dehydrogenase (short-subunit alcohol dehydrogenase family)
MGILDGSTMLVSGVGTGLGRRIALAAARDGARLVLVARSKDMLASVVGEIEADAGTAISHVADISDPEQCQAAVDATVERYGQLDALVNCAAMDSVFGGVATTSSEDWHRTIEVNLFGSMSMVRSALEPLRAKGGSIVFIGSQTMYMPPGEAPQIAYAASKGALLGAMRHLTREVGPSGIRVNMVTPGWMWGPPVQGFVRGTAKAEGVSEDVVLARLTSDMPLQRMPTDAEVAEAVIFLSSRRASGITGQSLLVNAGEYMQ